MKRPSLKYQALRQLDSMASYGTSKHNDKKNNAGKPALNKIYSYRTMKNYKDWCLQFTEYVKKAHGCKTLAAARQFTGEYLQNEIRAGRSAWTVRAHAAALAKLYQTKTTDLDCNLPARHYMDIKQHRSGAEKGHYAANRHKELEIICRGAGLRRSEVIKLRPEQIQENAGKVTITVKGKGGKTRTAEVLPEYAPKIAAIARRASQEGKTFIDIHVPKYAPIHALRAEYAKGYYTIHARPISSLSRKEIYIADDGGIYDKRALLITSKMLGHSRYNVVVQNYLHR